VDIAMNRLDADALSSMLIRTDPPLLSGGTVSLALNGSWPGPATSDIDLTLAASPRDTTLALPGIEPTEIDAMTLPISLTGPLNNPAVGISDEAVRRALVDAGKRELFDRLSDRLDLSDALDGEGGSVERGVRDAVGGLFGNRGGDDGDDGER
jgi:hypothetical protein